MVKLKNHWQAIPNGFFFVDAPISDAPMGPYWEWNTMINEIIARRISNPRFKLPTDRPGVEAEADEQNAMRMLAMPAMGGKHFIIQDGGPEPNFPLPPRHQWQSVAGGLKNLATGALVLTDWLGAGGTPVNAELANARAVTCSVCPQNGQGDWTRFFTEPAANQIRKQLELKHNMKLETQHDAKLGVCKACSCPLALKCQTPLSHILAHLNDETKAKLDVNCWITKESV